MGTRSTSTGIREAGMKRVDASGDCIGGNRQVASSVGEGVDVAINLLEELCGATDVDDS